MKGAVALAGAALLPGGVSAAVQAGSLWVVPAQWLDMAAKVGRGKAAADTARVAARVAIGMAIVRPAVAARVAWSTWSGRATPRGSREEIAYAGRIEGRAHRPA